MKAFESAWSDLISDEKKDSYVQPNHFIQIHLVVPRILMILEVWHILILDYKLKDHRNKLFIQKFK
jgi:hypothetical protein